MKKEFISLIDYLHSPTIIPTYSAGNRRCFRNFKWEVKEFFYDPITLEMMGYNKVKLTLLKKNYEDPSLLQGEVDKFYKDLEKGASICSASLSFITGKKDKKLKSACMNSAVVMRDPTGTTIDIFYRSTEAIKKFGGDLIFLPQLFRRYLKPETIKEVKHVTFHFVLIFVAPIYYPLAYTWGVRFSRDSNYHYHKVCRHQLYRAVDLSIKPKYSQTARAYETFRRYIYGNELEGKR